MTEEALYIIQNDIYWMINDKFQKNNIPPMIQKMIMEGIYSRYQTESLKYEWEIRIQNYAKNQEAENNSLIIKPIEGVDNEQNQETEG